MSETNGELHFADIAMKEVPVTIGEDNYVLCEASEETAELYQNATMRGVTMQDGLVRLSDSMAGAQSLLVSRCLFKIEDDNTRRCVSQKTVQSWPSRIVKPLFETAKKISDLDVDEETGEARAKNAQSETAEPTS